MKQAVFILFLSLSVSAWAQQNGRTELNLPDHPMLGQHFARGDAGRVPPGRNPNMTYHFGSVLTSPTTVKAIFWGAKWNTTNYPAFAADKITGLDLFYGTVSNSPYAITTTEYTDSSTLNVSPVVQYVGSVQDYTAAPSKAPSTSTILAEVCKMVTPVANGYYPVYVDTPRGSANYCAWHSWGSCNGTPIEFGFFFNLDGDPGCDPQDSSGLHSQGLAALANVSGHELSETLTDPTGSAWFDGSGAENADKCAWSFGTPLLTFASNSKWKIQGNWSNRDYNSKTGYANNSGQKGCIDGGNYPLQ